MVVIRDICSLGDNMALSQIYVEFDIAMSKYHIFATVALNIYSVGVLKLQ